VVVQGNANQQTQEQLGGKQGQLRFQRPGLQPGENPADQETGRNQHYGKTRDAPLKGGSLRFS
jgi:hypothetical protein